MPKAIDEGRRDAILTDIRAGESSRNQIARKHGVAASTVTKIAQTAGLESAFDRSQTKSATAGRLADLHAATVRAAQLALQRTIEVLPYADARSAPIAYGILADKARQIERDQAGGDAAQVGELLTSLFGGMRAARAETESAPD